MLSFDAHLINAFRVKMLAAISITFHCCVGLLTHPANFSVRRRWAFRWCRFLLNYLWVSRLLLQVGWWVLSLVPLIWCRIRIASTRIRWRSVIARHITLGITIALIVRRSLSSRPPLVPRRVTVRVISHTLIRSNIRLLILRNLSFLLSFLHTATFLSLIILSFILIN